MSGRGRLPRRAVTWPVSQSTGGCVWQDVGQVEGTVEGGTSVWPLSVVQGCKV